MKITNAMYMISSTKLRKAKKDAELNNPYFEAMQEMLINIMNTSDHLQHPFTDRRPDKKREDRVHAVIVVTADKGLAGAYNHNVVKLTEDKFLSGKERRYILKDSSNTQHRIRLCTEQGLSVMK